MFPVFAEEEGLSWGGVTGGAGMAGVVTDAVRPAAASAAALTSAERLEGERRSEGRSMLEEAALKGGGGLEAL